MSFRLPTGPTSHNVKTFPTEDSLMSVFLQYLLNSKKANHWFDLTSKWPSSV